jgi:phage regulator Rha-like protein
MELTEFKAKYMARLLNLRKQLSKEFKELSETIPAEEEVEELLRGGGG